MTHNSAGPQNLSAFSVRLYNFRATNVDGLDKSGTSDPYLKVNFDNHTRFHTKYIKKEKNPVWGLDKSFIYETAYPGRDALMLKTMRIKCADHEKVHKARLIGIAKVDLYTLATGPVKHDIPLLDEYDNECGRVQFACEFIDLADVTVVLKDIVLDHIPHRIGSSRPYLRITDGKMLGLPLDTPIYAEHTEEAKWEGPHAFTFRASLPDMLGNALRVSVMDKRPIDIGEKESHSDHLAEFKLRLGKYYDFDFDAKKEIPFSQTARKPKEASDHWPAPNVQATLSGNLLFTRVPTYCQMHQGLHTEKGITDAVVFSSKCPMPSCPFWFAPKNKVADSTKPAPSSIASQPSPSHSSGGFPPQGGPAQFGAYPGMAAQAPLDQKAGNEEYDVDDDSDDDGNDENTDAQLARMTTQQLQINVQNAQAQRPYPSMGQNPGAFVNQAANLHMPAVYNRNMMLQPSPSHSPQLSPQHSPRMGAMGAPPGMGVGGMNPGYPGGMNPGYTGGMGAPGISAPGMNAPGMSAHGGMSAPGGMNPNFVQPGQPNASGGGMTGFNSNPNAPLPSLNPGYAPPSFSAAPQSPMPALNPGYGAAAPGYTAAASAATSTTMPALNPGYAPATASAPPAMNPNYHPSPAPTPTTQMPYGGSAMAARTANYGGGSGRRSPSGGGGGSGVPLPAGWSSATAPDGRTYYKNDVTKSTTWMRPTAPAVAPLPAGWSEAKAPDGRTYYKNDVMKTTSWDRPTQPAIVSQQPQRSPNHMNNSAPLPHGWSQHVDSSGKTYYKDHINKKTSWNRPTVAATQPSPYNTQPNYTAQPRGGYPGQRGRGY